MGRTFRPVMIWWALGLGLVLATAACVVNPVSGEKELSFMSEAEELALGQENYPKTTQANNGLPGDDPALQAYVREMGNTLAALSHRPDMPWEFNVVNSSDVNAFALPGGKISFTRGIITQMNSDDEVAFVMGHEIGHVTARHSANQYTNGVLIQTAVLGLGVALALSSDSNWAPVGAVAAGAAGSLLLLSYSRDQERQADELGHDYMTRASYNPKATLKVFDLFLSLQDHQPSMVEAWMASHPLTDERIQLAKARLDLTDPRLLSQPFKVDRFQKVIAKQKDRAPAYNAMDEGDKAMKGKNLTGAAQDYEKAISLFPKEGLFHTRLAQVRLSQDNPQAALDPARQGARLQPNLYMAQLVLGVAYGKLGDNQKALEAHLAAQKIMPDQPVNTFLTAYNFDKLGKRNEAAGFYNLTSRLDPNGKLGRAAAGRMNQLR